MKKDNIIAGLTLGTLCLALGMSVCAEEDQQKSKEILMKVAEVNSFENSLIDHENMQIDYKYYGEEEWEEQIYFSEDCFVYLSPNWSYIHTGEDAYGWDEAVGNYVLLQINDEEDALEKNYEDIPYYVYEDGDEVLSLKETDKELELVVSGEKPVGEDVIQNQKVVMLVDAENYEIKKLDLYMVEEEEETLFCSIEVTYNVDPYIPDEEMKASVYGTEGNTRSVTVVVNPDTEEEKAYAAVVGRETNVQLFPTDEYSVLYTDKECTEPYQRPENENPEELLVYMKENN